jgi:hypothetical protein
MLTKDDIETIALLIARANSHPAPAEYAACMLNQFAVMQNVATAALPTPLIGAGGLVSPPAPGDYAAAMLNEFAVMQNVENAKPPYGAPLIGAGGLVSPVVPGSSFDVPPASPSLIGTQVLSDPTQWPQSAVTSQITDSGL